MSRCTYIFACWNIRIILHDWHSGNIFFNHGECKRQNKGKSRLEIPLLPSNQSIVRLKKKSQVQILDEKLNKTDKQNRLLTNAKCRRCLSFYFFHAFIKFVFVQVISKHVQSNSLDGINIHAASRMGHFIHYIMQIDRYLLTVTNSIEIWRICSHLLTINWQS